MKRISLFAGFDAQNEVGAYVVWYVKALSEISDVYYLADCPMLNSELEKLKPYTKGAWAYRHEKYDFGSWQELMIKIGASQLKQYNQIILANDSCYGPLFDLKEVFLEMQNRDLHFWGLTRSSHLKYGRHLHSYFLVFNKQVIQSDFLYNFFYSVKKEDNFLDIVFSYEVPLTAYLTRKGFVCGSYALQSDDRPWSLIKRHKMPLIKVKVFTKGYSKQRKMRWKAFLKKQTDYDPQIIQEDLNRRGYTRWNIFANVSLLRHQLKRAGRLSEVICAKLASSIKRSRGC